MEWKKGKKENFTFKHSTISVHSSLMYTEYCEEVMQHSGKHAAVITVLKHVAGIKFRTIKFIIFNTIYYLCIFIYVIHSVLTFFGIGVGISKLILVQTNILTFLLILLDAFI